MSRGQLCVTSAVPDANGKLHIGHIREYIQADSGVIVSSGQAFLNNRDLNYILSDANRGAVEKVVVERNVATGQVLYRMVPLERLERARRAAKTQTIWNSDPAAMLAKTVYHQAASRRWFPLAADVQAALTMAEELDLPPASAHTAQMPAVVPAQLKAVRLPSLPQVQPVAQPEAVDVDFTDTEEAANV